MIGQLKLVKKSGWVDRVTKPVLGLVPTSLRDGTHARNRRPRTPVFGMEPQVHMGLAATFYVRGAFNKVNKFAQGEAQWKEFRFDLAVMIGVLETVKVVERMPDETDTPMVRAPDVEHADKLDLDTASKELYEVLVTLREGEAKLKGQECLQQ